MKRSVLLLLALFCTLALGTAPALSEPGIEGREFKVVRHREFESWSRFRTRVDRAEATTELIREKARSYEISREFDELRLEALRDQLNPEGERTLGRACIYGRKDEVLFQPEGKTC